MTISKAVLEFIGPRLNADCDSRAVLEYLSDAIERTRGKENRFDIDVHVLENLLLVRYMLFGIDCGNGGCDVCGRVKPLCHPLNCPPKLLVAAE